MVAEWESAILTKKDHPTDLWKAGECAASTRSPERSRRANDVPDGDAAVGDARRNENPQPIGSGSTD